MPIATTKLDMLRDHMSDSALLDALCIVLTYEHAEEYGEYIARIEDIDLGDNDEDEDEED